MLGNNPWMVKRSKYFWNSELSLIWRRSILKSHVIMAFLSCLEMFDTTVCSSLQNCLTVLLLLLCLAATINTMHIQQFPGYKQAYTIYFYVYMSAIDYSVKLWCNASYTFNILRPRQNGRYLTKFLYSDCDFAGICFQWGNQQTTTICSNNGWLGDNPCLAPNHYLNRCGFSFLCMYTYLVLGDLTWKIKWWK